jgi:hypothetical protein
MKQPRAVTTHRLNMINDEYFDVGCIGEDDRAIFLAEILEGISA